MARRKGRSPSVSFIRQDLAAWNFVIFLALAFILLVIVLTAMNKVSLDLRSRAGLACPDPLAAFDGRLPAANQCAGEWKLTSDVRGCQVFACEANKLTK